MVGEVLKFDHTNISYAVATEAARIRSDAFRNDGMFKSIYPPRAQFRDENLPSIADYEQLQQLAALYGKVIRSEAREIYLTVSRDPRTVLYMLKDKGKFRASAQWILPEYVPVARIPWHRRAYIWILEKLFSLADTLSFWGKENPAYSPEILARYHKACRHLGCYKQPETAGQLAKMSRKELESVCYPKDLAYVLEVLSVHADTHGQGYGRQIVLTSEKRITSNAVPPPGIDGPPKVTIVSMPTAIGFYKRLGFTMGAHYEDFLPSKAKITQSYFFRNVD